MLTKCELPEADRVRDELAATLGQDVLAISAVTGQGLNKLMERVFEGAGGAQGAGGRARTQATRLSSVCGSAGQALAEHLPLFPRLPGVLLHELGR